MTYILGSVPLTTTSCLLVTCPRERRLVPWASYFFCCPSSRGYTDRFCLISNYSCVRLVSLATCLRTYSHLTSADLDLPVFFLFLSLPRSLSILRSLSLPVLFFFLQVAGEDDVVVLAEELREAVRELGCITGEVGFEEILDVVFGDFCIGK